MFVCFGLFYCDLLSYVYACVGLHAAPTHSHVTRARGHQVSCSVALPYSL